MVVIDKRNIRVVARVVIVFAKIVIIVTSY